MFYYRNTMKYGIILIFLLSTHSSKAQVDTTLYGWIDSTTNRHPEVSSAFSWGEWGWAKYVKNELKYPKAAKKNNTQGTVIVEFTISIDGTTSDLKIFKSVEKSLDEEAFRLIQNGRWVPAIHNGRHVKSRRRQEIEFRLR